MERLIFRSFWFQRFSFFFWFSSYIWWLKLCIYIWVYVYFWFCYLLWFFFSNMFTSCMFACVHIDVCVSMYYYVEKMRILRCYMTTMSCWLRCCCCYSYWCSYTSQVYFYYFVHLLVCIHVSVSVVLKHVVQIWTCRKLFISKL